jgi:hypothetical protein
MTDARREHLAALAAAAIVERSRRMSQRAPDAEPGPPGPPGPPGRDGMDGVDGRDAMTLAPATATFERDWRGLTDRVVIVPDGGGPSISIVTERDGAGLLLAAKIKWL